MELGLDLGLGTQSVGASTPVEAPEWVPEGALFAFKPEDNSTHAWFDGALVPFGDVLDVTDSIIDGTGIHGAGTIELTGNLLTMLRSMAADDGYSLATTYTFEDDVPAGVSWVQSYLTANFIFSTVLFGGAWLTSWGDEGGQQSAQLMEPTGFEAPFSTGSAFFAGPAIEDFAMAVNGGAPIMGDHAEDVFAPDATGTSIYTIPADFVINGLFLFPPATGPGYEELTGWTQFSA